jgi:hypothetical protein
MTGPPRLGGATVVTGPPRLGGITGVTGLSGLMGPSGLVGMTGSDGPEGPDCRGSGTAGSRGLAWPPRSLELQDTIRLPVTFAVSARGLFPWLHPVVLGLAAYRRSVCRGPDPTPL